MIYETDQACGSKSHLLPLFYCCFFPHSNITRSPRSMCPDGGFFSRAFKWVVAHRGLISTLTHCRGIQLPPLTPLHATFLNATLDSGLTRNASTILPLTNIQKWITPTAERHVTLFTLQRRLHLKCIGVKG